jgi:hypothetical protein
MRLHRKIGFALLASIALLASGCGGGSGGSSGGGSTPPSTPSTVSEWTWMSGSSTAGAAGVYGTRGVASASNVPGGRTGSVRWIDSSGNFWLFGGTGYGSNGSIGNDLWEFNPTSKEWTWVGGASAGSTPGSYGTLGVASATNMPGDREGGVSWTDGNGNFWLFGGVGFGSTLPAGGSLNDLWEFNPTTKMWTWMSGSSAGCAPGVYGTQGAAAASNVPGARSGSVSWTDSSGNFWLFGGDTLSGGSSCQAGTQVFFNDLWEFNPTTKEWTWVSGSSTTDAVGAYGILGVASLSNVPGARSGATNWTDSSGNLWLFGGGDLNDLWEFSPTTKMWAWVSGSSTAGAAGVYGTQGVAAATNVPGFRNGAVSWTDSSGNLWLFGGQGYGSTETVNGGLNDLWEFNPPAKVWTWVSGSDTANATGIYGTLSTASSSNVPGGRVSALSWIDSSGNLWLFGGESLNPVGSVYNDLWRYQP